MNRESLMALFTDSAWQEILEQLYGKEAVPVQKERYRALLDTFSTVFGEKTEGLQLFSSPGRTEIGGNHTDHNFGKVLTGSIDLDSIAVAAPTEDEFVYIYDVKYKEDFSIHSRDIEKRPGERGAISLIRGILRGFSERGLRIGGFKACVNSSVISAAGVSSSASFEMLICTILDDFYNESSVPKTVYAQIGQFAENTYWDKASGLLDQMACAVGGLTAIDFENPAIPQVRQIKKSFSDYGYGLVIVNTGKGHADLSEEYSLIPKEMKSVASFFGKTVCREISKELLLEHSKDLESAVGSRAILRALHFFEENDRVDREVDALENGRFDDFLKEITASGDSSWKWLQNCYCPGEIRHQEISYTLALTDLYIRDRGWKAACRVHGGGFAGVIMAILPEKEISEYMDFIRKAGKEPYKMNIRKIGAVNVLKM